MAFVCTISPESWHAEIFQEGNELGVLVHIGYDDRADLNYFLSAGLSPSGGGYPDFYFCVVEVDGARNSERDIWSSSHISKIIEREDRRQILDLLLCITARILRTTNENYIAMFTVEANLPGRALEKYHLINQVFIECGYEVREADPFHGRKAWYAERCTC